MIVDSILFSLSLDAYLGLLVGVFSLETVVKPVVLSTATLLDTSKSSRTSSYAVPSRYLAPCLTALAIFTTAS